MAAPKVLVPKANIRRYNLKTRKHESGYFYFAAALQAAKRNTPAMVAILRKLTKE
jgi:hypothetical protein